MIESLGLYFILIPALSTFILFICNGFIHFPLDQNLLVLSLILSVALIALIFPIKIKSFTRPKLNFTAPALLLLTLLLFYLFSNYLFNWYWPPTEFDALSMYDYRGKVFYLNHNIQDISDGYHASYPLLTSLSHTMFYLLNIPNVKLFYSLILTGVLMIFYSLLRRHNPRLVSLFLICLFITTPCIFYHSQIAYTNFVYLAYLGLSFIYLAELMMNYKRHDLLAYSLLIAAASWTRPATHQFFLIHLFLLIFILFKNKQLKDILLPVFIYCIFSLPWNYYQANILKTGTYESTSLLKLTSVFHDSIPSLFFVLKALFDNLTTFTYSGGVGLLFIFTISAQTLVSIKKIFHPYTFVLILNLCIWVILSVAIQTEFNTHDVWLRMLYDSMQRLFIIYFPLIIATLAILPFTQSIFKKISKFI